MLKTPKKLVWVKKKKKIRGYKIRLKILIDKNFN